MTTIRKAEKKAVRKEKKAEKKAVRKEKKAVRKEKKGGARTTYSENWASQK